MHKPDDKVFCFNDVVKALEEQDSMADLEPYSQLLNALARALGVDTTEPGTR